MKQRVVVFSPEAEDDLGAVYDWIANRAGATVAFGYVERLTNAALGLSLASERGTLRSDIRNGLRVIGFERRATIAFSVSANRVTILRIFQGGQDWEAVLS